MNTIQNRRKVNMVCYMLVVTLLFGFFPDFGINKVYGYVEKTGVVFDGTLNIRSGPGTSYTKIGSFADGAIVNIIGEAYATDGALWYKVKFYSNAVLTEGYVHSAYITNVQDVIDYTEDADFEAYLNSQGFPESYKDGLRALHAKYPKWVFVADHLNYTWDEAWTAQSKLGRSLIGAGSISSWKSVEDGAYNWETGKWIGYDTDSWVCASKELVAYFMDPRNFLDEEAIFQFQLLSYNPSIHTIDNLRTLVSGSFLSTGSIINDETGNNISYVEAVMLAAQKSNVSPYALASSIIFEMGSNGSSNSISGTYAGYEGYYNYYNWGASAHSGRNPIQNGLLYAMNTDASTLRPWNTRYKALIGGAIKFGADYINIGQDTAYYKKFDYVGTPYTHQYMTNIMGAYLEGTKAAQGFSLSIRKGTSLVFKIPVFKNMPKKPAACPTGTGSPNNCLKSLSIEGYNLTPTFNMYTEKYSLIVGNEVSGIKVSAAAVDSTATVSGTGNINLKEGSNEVIIKVTSQSGSVRNYVITVVREEAEEPDNGNGGGQEPETPDTGEKKPVVSTTLTKNDTDKTINGIDSKTAVNTALSKITVQNGSCYIADKNGTKKTEGNTATGDKLIVLDNAGNKVSEYTFILYGDVNGDGLVNIVDALRIKRYILGDAQLEGVYMTAGDANRKNDGVNIVDALRIKRFVLGEISINQK